ncbi:MAG: hypothetical protein ACRDRW_05805 [Pseudonocardiaceae bacterium]
MTADSERPRLREYRHQLGWTQQEMAERLAHLAWMQRREHVIATCADRRSVSTTTPDAGAPRDPDHGGHQILPVLSAAGQTVG